MFLLLLAIYVAIFIHLTRPRQIIVTARRLPVCRALQFDDNESYGNGSRAEVQNATLWPSESGGVVRLGNGPTLSLTNYWRHHLEKCWNSSDKKTD